MQKIVVHTKTTFYTYHNPILITDNRGKEFYFYKWDNTKFSKQCFNLPKGIYYSKYPVFKCDYEINFEKIPNEKPEKDDYKRIEKILLKKTKNPHKATIYIFENKPVAIIEYDASLDEKPYYIKDFIIGHELGHLYYETEALCDRFSRNLCLSLGYNPSQLNKAIEYTLTSFTKEGNHRISISHSDNKFTSLKTVLTYGRE